MGCISCKPIFGAPLVEIEKDNQYFNVPKIVVECIKFIEKYENITECGIYQVSPNKSSINHLKFCIKTGNYSAIECRDVHTVAGLLKLFFKKLKTDLIPIDIMEFILNLIEENQKPDINAIREEISILDPMRRETLKFLIRHLHFVDKHCKANRMNAPNLAVVWGPSLFASHYSKAQTTNKTNTLLTILIENYKIIFE